MTKRKVRIAQIGLGPIGLECLRLAASTNWARVVGAVDIDPQKVGKELEIWIKDGSSSGKRVVGRIDDLPEKPDLVFHTAVSRFRTAYSQLESLAKKGIHVVSSCEELVFPRLREPELASRLDRLCRKTGSRIVGTGVNPGFVMDLLPLCLTAVTRDIQAIHIQRVVNASTRREPLQKKIGSGLPPAQFRRLLAKSKAGHAGLNESLALVAHVLGWTVGEIVEMGDAVVARRNIQTQYLSVRRGETCGLHQRAEAKVDGKLRLSLDLKMYLEAENPHDAIQIKGNPPLDLTIKGGVAGDQATVAALVNTAPRLLKAQPGLRLLTELPVA